MAVVTIARGNAPRKRASRADGWFFSAPDDLPPMRFGDPLGLRNVTDEVSDIVAPGLSYSTVDARWISLLCWSLARSQQPYEQAVGKPVVTAEGRQSRYEWLRPLELLWVARALRYQREKDAEYRALQWPGSRILRVGWNGRSPDFGFSVAQLQRYRQAGPYGAYRVVLRNPALTTGDGWTLRDTGVDLARWVKTRLRLESTPPGANRASASNPAGWWLRSGWSTWQEFSRDPVLPSRREPPQELPERALLAQVLFPKDSDRKRTVQIVRKHPGASHAGLMEAIGGEIGHPELGQLADLSECGLATTLAVARAVGAGELTLASLAKKPDVVEGLRVLTDSSRRWLKVASTSKLQYAAEATRFAEAMQSGGTMQSRVAALVAHHEQYHRGRRWMARVPGDSLVRADDEVVHEPSYGYRLEPLVHLAIQCGVLSRRRAPKVLLRQATNDVLEREEEE